MHLAWWIWKLLCENYRMNKQHSLSNEQTTAEKQLLMHREIFMRKYFVVILCEIVGKIGLT